MQETAPRAEASTSAGVAHAIVDVIPLVMRRIRAHMRANTASISPSQFRALVFLDRHAGSSLGALADFLGVTDATASVLVQRFVQGGLARRVDRPGERRAVAITLTPRGERFIGRARSETRARIAATLGRLPARDLATVREALDILGRVFEREDGAVDG